MTQARKRLPATKLVTDKALAHFAYVNEPDTKGDYADGKYKITLSFPKDDPFVTRLDAAVEKLCAEHFGDKRPRNLHTPVKDGDDSNLDAMAGRVFIRAKSNKQPLVVDSKRNKLPEGLTIFGGDVVKAAITLAVYEAGASKGVTAYLDALQLIEKRSSGSNTASMFGDEDGYEAPEATESTSALFDDDDDL